LQKAFLVCPVLLLHRPSLGPTYGEVRKFKDDGVRRMRVIKEIVEYVEIIDAT
jgi:hypothetical protein